MKTVIIESPYRSSYGSEKEVFRSYLDDCIRDCLGRNESPYASHLILTSVLDDDVPEQRTAGINTGYAWYQAADRIAFYEDHGWSEGMVQARAYADLHGIAYIIRSLNS